MDKTIINTQVNIYDCTDCDLQWFEAWGEEKESDCPQCDHLHNPSYSVPMSRILDMVQTAPETAIKPVKNNGRLAMDRVFSYLSKGQHIEAAEAMAMLNVSQLLEYLADDLNRPEMALKAAQIFFNFQKKPPVMYMDFLGIEKTFADTITGRKTTERQEAIDESFMLAARCGRVEELGWDSHAKREFTKIAVKLREYASPSAREIIKNEQIDLDCARLNNKSLHVVNLEGLAELDKFVAATESMPVGEFNGNMGYCKTRSLDLDQSLFRRMIWANLARFFRKTKKVKPL